jgi:ABC-type Mn2+/Zn2+ transport system ATPase subunit
MHPSFKKNKIEDLEFTDDLIKGFFPINNQWIYFEIPLKNNPLKWVGLTGPNGVGKSTLLRFIKTKLSLNSPSPNSFEKLITFNSQFLDQAPMKVLGERTLQDLFNLLKNHHKDNFLFPHQLCEKLNVADFLHRPINLLSGGENQMVKLLATFSVTSSLYFLDEPFSFLDLGRREILCHHLHTLKNQHHSPIIILIDHHQEYLDEFCEIKIKLHQTLGINQ